MKMTRRRSFSTVAGAFAGLATMLGRQQARAQHAGGLQTGDITSCHELDHCVAGQVRPITEGKLAGKGALIQGADCCWRYLDLTPVSDGEDLAQCDGYTVDRRTCQPGTLNMVLDGGSYGQINVQGMDCCWHAVDLRSLPGVA